MRLLVTKRTFLNLLVLLGTLLSIDCVGDSGREPRTPLFNKRCGPNALVQFLTLAGKGPKDEAINAIECGSQGASLLQLHDVAALHGLKTEIRKYELDDFESVPLPAIVHAPADNDNHHFYVWYGSDQETVHVLDGLTGQDYKLRKQRLAYFWTGYALIHGSRLQRIANRLSDSGISVACLTFANLILLLVVAFRNRWQLRASVLRHPLVILPCLVWLSMSREALSSEMDSVPEVGQVWRNADHGGLNAIYVFARLHGFSDGYEKVQRRVAFLPTSLDEVLDCSRSLGYPLRSRFLSRKQLWQMKLPVIAHLDGDTPDTGVFVVITNWHSDSVQFVNGPTASVTYLPYEDFLRRWSGVILVPSARTSSATRLAAVAIGIFVGTMTGWMRHVKKEDPPKAIQVKVKAT